MHVLTYCFYLVHYSLKLELVVMFSCLIFPLACQCMVFCPYLSNTLSFHTLLRAAKLIDKLQLANGNTRFLPSLPGTLVIGCFYTVLRALSKDLRGWVV